MVVSTAVVIAIRLVLAHSTVPDKPAMPPAERVRAAVAPKSVTPESLVPSPLRRVRSALLLVVIVTVLGALTALLLVIGGAILLTGVRNAVQ